MKNHYFETWKVDCLASNKLKFFNIFKDNYETEPYLNVIDNFEQRRHFSKFRISNHKLEIEAGRYSNTKAEDRLCTVCDLSKIENEFHLLYHCPFYDDLRNEFYDKISHPCQVNFSNLNLTSELFRSDDKDIIQYLSKYIYKCFKRRQDKLFPIQQ